MVRIREMILETLNARGPLPVGEIARAAGLSSMAARYHIRLLEHDGLVARQACEHCGKVGRPVLAYALSDVGRERLPKRYDALAAQLLEEMAGSIGAQETHALLRRIGRRLAASAPPAGTVSSRPARLARAARFLAARGYVAQVKCCKHVFALDVQSCPYRRVAQAHPEVCEIDRAMLGALMQVPDRGMRQIRNADGQCRFEFAREK